MAAGTLIVNPKKLETGLRTNSAGIPYTVLLRTEATGFPTFGLLLYKDCMTRLIGTRKGSIIGL